MSAAKQLWREHLSAAFPTTCYEEKAAGVDLVRIDALVAGCAQSVIEQEKKIELGHAEVMSSCRASLAKALRTLEGEEKEYFMRVDRLAEIALSAAM